MSCTPEQGTIIINMPPSNGTHPGHHKGQQIKQTSFQMPPAAFGSQLPVSTCGIWHTSCTKLNLPVLSAVCVIACLKGSADLLIAVNEGYGVYYAISYETKL